MIASPCLPLTRQITRAPSLSSVTRIDRSAECDPLAVGMTTDGVERIWAAVQTLYKTRLHPSLTLMIRRHGQVVIKRAIGCADGNLPGQDGPQIAMDPDAPQCIFSASKAVTALLVHKLVEEGELRLTDRVSDYIPEFAQNGKQDINIRGLLSHRAGVPFIPREQADPDLLLDWDRVVQMICELPPHYPNPATVAYHALTGGFIIGEIVKRVAGMELTQALDEWIRKPLGCRYLTYGLTQADRGKLAHNAFTGPPAIWPLSTYIRRITGVPFRQATEVSCEDTFLSSVVPAGNIHASADDLNRVFQMLLNGGELDGVRVLKESTVKQAIRPVGRIRRDRAMHVPIRYSAGFMLGENPFGLYGPKCGQAFGHLGFVNILGWADPQRQISVSFLNTGKSVSPIGLFRLSGVLRSIAKECEPII